VLRDNGGGTGLLEAGGLRGLDGTLRPIAGPAGIAHPWHLLGAETLGAWQREIVRRRLVQPVKQVFRELYVSPRPSGRRGRPPTGSAGGSWTPTP